MTERRSIKVTAPARIHCGLLSVGTSLPVNFGGCGLMVDWPQTQVRLSPGRSGISCPNNLLEKVEWVRDRCLAIPELSELPVSLEVLSQPPQHSGFGSGTQLAFAIAAGWFVLAGRENLKPEELALVLGRGMRSAIGTFGFFQGGFLIDRGVSSERPISPLALRIDFPDWPILVVSFPQVSGLHGVQELQAFDRIVSTTSAERTEMEELLNQEIVPALFAKDFSKFAEAIYEFGTRSGNYYREFQRGTFHSRQVAEVAEWFRDHGVPGVVQSSWGPTLAAFVENQSAANSIVIKLKERFGESVEPLITAANNCGAKFEFEELS
jgi:beta-ribofuranosylaminobenzene 5'-phosphate synthase